MNFSESSESNYAKTLDVLKKIDSKLMSSPNNQNFVLKIPFSIEAPLIHSDALQDVYLRFKQLVNYIGEILLTSQTAKENSRLPDKTILSIDTKSGDNEPINSLIIEILFDSWGNVLSRVPQHLFFSSIVQMATIYEVFLSELITDILQRNSKWLELDEKQISTKEIFNLGSLEKIKQKLINKKKLDYAMSSYPKKVEKFEKDFHVGLHSKTFPLSLFEVHDFLEVRNVIVHNDGHASEQYFERIKEYNSPSLLPRMYSTPRIDFCWLLIFGNKLMSLCTMVDEDVGKKWATSRNSRQTAKSER